MRLYFTVIGLILLGLFAFGLATSVWAAPSQFQETFDQGFFQWEAARGDLSLWSVEGEKAKATVTTQSTLTEIVPRDEYWNPNWHNLSYTFEYTPITGTDRNLSFGYQDSLNWYDLHFVDTFYELARVQNGIVTFDVFKNFELKNGQSYLMRLVLQDAHIQLFIDGQKIIDEVDWSFNQNFGKISLKATAGSIAPTIVQFDNLVVTPLTTAAEIHLGVPLVKQNDPDWKDRLYDRADEWSPNKTTIQNWGCALSSAVMILQYYGLNQLPDGTALSPATLNDWLLSQTDGYFDGGNVNWNAITRLTRLLNEAFGSVKLEYSRLSPTVENITTEVRANRPAIVGIPGHFLVADGVSADQEIEIKDPAYTYTQLSQHQTSLSSVGKFLPSFTDLSAVVVSAPNGLDIVLTDQNGQTPPGLQTSTEFLQDPSEPNGPTLPAKTYLLLSQPAEAEYFLHVAALSATGVEQKIQIFAYDQAANLSDLTQIVPANFSSADFLITFEPQGVSTLSLAPSWSDFRLALQTAHQNQQLPSSFIFFQLDRLAGLAEATPFPPRQRYKNLVLHQLENFQTDLNSEVFTQLNTILAAIP